MKALLLSFFAVILGYSLFTGEQEEQQAELPTLEQTDRVETNAYRIHQIQDSLRLAADKRYARLPRY